MAGRSRSRLAFFLPILFFLACKGDPVTPPAPETPFRAFYHWQTEFKLDSLERDWLNATGADRIYVKFFDLDRDAGGKDIIPLASVQMDTTGLQGRRVIPTIFITNRSMLQLPPAEIPQLAGRITEKIDRQFAGLGQPLRELQLDCDWTPQSRETYFALLEALKKNYAGREVRLSTTIRLHQLRYPEQTGVPPVDRGVLMFYNMGNLTEWSEPNSILNLEKAAAYLPDGLQYPLHLDLALPIFRWAVLFRDGKMIKLINEPTDSLLQQPQKLEPTQPGRYRVLENHYLDGYYLYRGDQLRVEAVSTEALRAAYELVKRQYPDAARSLIFYHLDRQVLDRYRPADLKGLN